ncbi:BrkDBD domain-containing protein [Trichostrongylus colubriformis]|uniref:BrkDBD domain-containing protein n=1 Tax=Trichostrongylus colubriformis TaxID=6319 RepID=A0AAN8FUI5_TRICO
MAGGATRNARKSRKRKNSEESTSAAPSRTLKQYSVDEKLEIIEFAKGNGNRAAGREYNVAESSIREWRKNEEKLRAVSCVDSERQETKEAVPREQLVGQIEVHEENKVPEFVRVSLSTFDHGKAPAGVTSENGTVTPANSSHHCKTDLSTSSSSSSHSNSPVLTMGSLSSSSSSRRKAKMPRKIIIEA